MQENLLMLFRVRLCLNQTQRSLLRYLQHCAHPDATQNKEMKEKKYNIIWIVILRWVYKNVAESTTAIGGWIRRRVYMLNLYPTEKRSWWEHCAYPSYLMNSCLNFAMCSTNTSKSWTQLTETGEVSWGSSRTQAREKAREAVISCFELRRQEVSFPKPLRLGYLST